MITNRFLKPACYLGNTSMAIVSTMSPILFLTFHSMYGISYSLLGTLVLINFFTQLTVDLIFSFFSHRFNIPKTIKIMPILTIIGFVIYSVYPFIFPNSVYIGLCIGTIIFSASSGLAEVLLSPIIAAIPSDDPDREMSKLHSVFAWGFVGVSVFCTLYIFIFGGKYWQYLTLLLTIIPIMCSVFFSISEIPHIDTPKKASGALQLLKNRGVWLCVTGIFLGGASECTMELWASGYLEKALNIPKIWGDIFGVALFAAMLGLGRTLYSKIGKNIEKVLLLCAISATVCYGISALSPISIIGLIACAFTGFCTSMMWPGSLIVASERYPQGGVFIFAMMAAGGDLGASVGPQLIGLITDFAAKNTTLINLATKIGETPDGIGMKLGMLVAMLFPLIAIPIFYRILKTKNQ